MPNPATRVFDATQDLREEGVNTKRFETLGKAIIREESSSVLQELGVELKMLPELTYGQRSILIAERVQAAVRKRDNQTAVLGTMLGMNSGMDDYASKRLQRLYHPSYLADAEAEANRKVHDWFTSTLINRVGWLTHKYCTNQIDHYMSQTRGAWRLASEGLELGEETRLKMSADDHEFELDYDWSLKDVHLIELRDHYATQYRYWKCMSLAIKLACAKVKEHELIEALGFLYLMNQADLDFETLRLVGAEQDRHTLSNAHDADEPSTITDNGEGGRWWWADLSVVSPSIGG